MIRKLILSMLVLSSCVFAEMQKAVLVDVISENILKVEHDGVTQRVHLMGIDLFSKANHATRDVDLETKDELKKESLAYIKRNLKIGSIIKYSVLYEDAGIQQVWLDKNELNYRIIRDGYALVNLDDPYLPTMFKMRMTIAMNYAKEKKLGLWGIKENPLLALIDTKQHMCGWKNQTQVTGITRLAILKEQQDALPKSAKKQHLEYLALNLNRY